jgi:hypothetical protein
MRIVISAKKSRDGPDTDLAGYPTNLKAGYRISGKARYGVPDIRLDILLDIRLNIKITCEI